MVVVVDVVVVLGVDVVTTGNTPEMLGLSSAEAGPLGPLLLKKKNKIRQAYVILLVYIQKRSRN